MKAITVEPKKPGTVRYEDFPEPDVREGSVVVEAIAAAVCGTDVEIAEGKYGWAPSGKTLGRERMFFNLERAVETFQRQSGETRQGKEG